MPADWPVIDPGKFRHRVALLNQSQSTDASGVSATWTAGPTIAWMAIEYVRGTDIIKAGQDVTQSYLKLTGWWRPEFTASQRVQVPSGAVYIIQAVENVLEMNQYMVLTCLGVGATT